MRSCTLFDLGGEFMEIMPGILDGIYLVSPVRNSYSALSIESDCVLNAIDALSPDLADNRCRSFLQKIVRNLSSIDYLSKRPSDYLEPSFTELKDEDEEVCIW